MSLRETGVTDEALDELKGLKRLERLNLGGAAVTPEGVARLRKALNGVAIEYAPGR